jgi:hypothetical protein
MKKTILLLMACCGFSNLGITQEKPALTEKDLEKYTYYFDIAGNKLNGNGADFLTAAFKKSQYVLLGEYHNSFQLSLFTRAIIPVLDDAGFRHFGVEIGPVSAELLKALAKDTGKLVERLHDFNSAFCVPTKNRTYTPIPFFGHVEDAAFLQEAVKRNWNLMGLDQEFLYAYLPLLERMYENLSPKKRKTVTALYEKLTAIVKTAYDTDNKGGKRCYETIAAAAEFEKFLILASEKNPANQAIAAALRKTTEIYLKSVARKYLEQNSERVAYMKQNLAANFTKARFDVQKDKMLLKIGGVHAGRGFSPLSLFELGNTLSELADFNGNQSLHINFNARYYKDNGKEVDELADTTGFGYRFKALLQMAKKDKWTVIDLRPLRYDIFYARRYKLDEIIWDIFKGYDLYIIAPFDIDPTPNFTVNK